MQVVTSIEHWDEVAHEIYFQATKENSPGERHLYKVRWVHSCCSIIGLKESSTGSLATSEKQKHQLVCFLQEMRFTLAFQM